MNFLKIINILYVEDYYLSNLKYLKLKSNFTCGNLNYENAKNKKDCYKRNKVYNILNDKLKICDRLLLCKELPRNKPGGHETINVKIIYKYLLYEYKKYFNYLNFSEVIESIKILNELERFYIISGEYDFFIQVKNVDKNVLNRLNEFEFYEKDLCFHRREVLGKICNMLIKNIHNISGNELIHFVVYFFKWNKNDKNLILFYNFYFNHVFSNLYLFSYEIYKILFIFSTYINNYGSKKLLFDKYLIKKNEFNVYYFKELKNDKHYVIRTSKEKIYKDCYNKLCENIDQIDNIKLLNILKLYVDENDTNNNNYLFNSVNSFYTIINNLHTNVIKTKNVEHLIKLLNMYSTIIKKKKDVVNDLLILKFKEVILSLLQIFKEKEIIEKKQNSSIFCCINYSTLINSVNNKHILNKIIDNNFVSFYEYLLKTFINIKFVNLQSLSISLISVKNIFFNLLKNKYYITNTLFDVVMEHSLKMCNNYFEKCIVVLGKKGKENTIYSISCEVIKNRNVKNCAKFENKSKEITSSKKRQYDFYNLENHFDLKFKLKVSDLLSIKILSNSFVKINKLHNSYDFYLLFNNISCILFYFLLNRHKIQKYNDTYIYILNDLSILYRNIKNDSVDDIKHICNDVKKLLCKNILKVSNIYIKNLDEEKFLLKEQYVCSLIFINNLFFDRIMYSDYIKQIWCHIYKAYNYFKNNRIINEDIISLLLLNCSKFQFYIENNLSSNNRYNRKELTNLKYNIIDDLTKNYLNTYKCISLDNLSKILISLSNSKFRYTINDDLLLASLKTEIGKFRYIYSNSDNNTFVSGAFVSGALSDCANSNKKKEDSIHSSKQYMKHTVCVNINKIMECLIKLDIFLHLKNRNTYIQLYKKTFYILHLQQNILKKLLYVANNLYIYEIYALVSNILQKSLGNKELISYNLKNNIKNKMFERIISSISDDDFIEIANTFFIFFYDYLKTLNYEKYHKVLPLYTKNCDIYFDQKKQENNNQTKNVEVALFNDNNNNEHDGCSNTNSVGTIDCATTNHATTNHVTTNHATKHSKNSVINIFDKQSMKKCSKIIECNDYYNSIVIKNNYTLCGDIMNLFKFLKVDKNKLILIQLYLYLCDIKKLKNNIISSSAFHTDVFEALKNMSTKHLMFNNYKIKNEHNTFMYTIDIVLFKIKY
ncbi:conserved protein, unknown function [Hepatocystis sp. ex Piliocolobus tephrosceles]|nr:conserved protein, unknown function [Hepatocystis sp. ex Piliocolobus tephrosceles]